MRSVVYPRYEAVESRFLGLSGQRAEMSMGCREHDIYAQVGRVAQRLGVSEFVLFERAYRHWYGAIPPEESLKRAFGCYLRTGTIPAWVRSYLRQRCLDDPPCPRSTAAQRIARWTIVGWLVLCFALFTGLL